MPVTEPLRDVGARLLEVGDHHLGAGGGEGPGHALAEALGGAGDEGGSAAEVVRRHDASTFGMISSVSRFMSSSVFDTGTSANGGQSSGIVRPASW